MLGVYPPRAETPVVLYSREQFSDITRLAAWSAAAYDGRIRVPLGDALETSATSSIACCRTNSSCRGRDSVDAPCRPG